MNIHSCADPGDANAVVGEVDSLVHWYLIKVVNGSIYDCVNVLGELKAILIMSVKEDVVFATTSRRGCERYSPVDNDKTMPRC